MQRVIHPDPAPIASARGGQRAALRGGAPAAAASVRWATPDRRSALTRRVTALASPLMAMIRKTTAACAALVALLVLVGGPLGAETVYRWTDARGVVHFSDMPPPGTIRSQAQTLPDVPVPIGQQPAEPAAAEPAAPPLAPAGEDKAPSGPARVVLTEQQADAVGPAVKSFHGKVTNKGGAEARDVFIALVVREPVQGDECLREEIDVTPSSLAPGAEGTFEAEFETPCFHGETTADLRASWR